MKKQQNNLEERIIIDKTIRRPVQKPTPPPAEKLYGLYKRRLVQKQDANV